MALRHTAPSGAASSVENPSQTTDAPPSSPRRNATACRETVGRGSAPPAPSQGLAPAAAHAAGVPNTVQTSAGQGLANSRQRLAFRWKGPR